MDHNSMDSQSPQLDLIRPIGRGAAGTTLYKAIHRPSGNIYAVKVIDACYEDDVFRNVLRQVQLLCGVDCPNVVKCYGVNFHPHHHGGGGGGEIHLVLEYVENSLQGAYVPHEPSLSYLARQILAGLAYLHGRGIAHRDLAPSNLMIDPVGVVKIADFGVSPILAQTADPFQPSILEYMCPERIDTDLMRGRRGGFEFAGDIWSLGICILELYMGKFPFPVGRRGDWGSLMSAICFLEPPVAPPWARPEFRDFIACCLQKDPAKRMTAVRLLKHPFITQYAPASPVSQSAAAGGHCRRSLVIH